MTTNKERVVEIVSPVSEYPKFKDQSLKEMNELRRRGLLITFENTTPVPDHRYKANQNVLDALERFVDEDINSTDPLALTGCMGCGKSTLVAEIHNAVVENGQKCEVYMQEKDKERTTKENNQDASESDENFLFLQGGEEGITTDIKVNFYKTFEDLLDEESGIPWNDVDVVVIDESMFPQDIENLHLLLKKAEENQVKVILSFLSTDFRGEFWEIMQEMIKLAKDNRNLKMYEILGRCDEKDCNEPSRFTTRETYVCKDEEGELIYRRSHYNEVLRQAGTVLRPDEIQGEEDTIPDRYGRSCYIHHGLKTPESAKAFDRQHGIDKGDYSQ